MPDMDLHDNNIAFFIAHRTGLPDERAHKIVKAGDPWPFVQAFSKLWQLSRIDAEDSDVDMEIALAANAELSNMGDEALTAEAQNRHLERTADLAGENIETVRTVRLALHDYFRIMIEQVERVAKVKAEER